VLRTCYAVFVVVCTMLTVHITASILFHRLNMSYAPSDESIYVTAIPSSDCVDKNTTNKSPPPRGCNHSLPATVASYETDYDSNEDEVDSERRERARRNPAAAMPPCPAEITHDATSRSNPPPPPPQAPEFKFSETKV